VEADHGRVRLPGISVHISETSSQSVKNSWTKNLRFQLDEVRLRRVSSVSPFTAARASLLFVEHGVVDGLALTVFSSIGGDPRLSVGRDHDVPRERRFAALLLHDFVRASVGL
jgi:hypothetical protein